MRKGLKCANMYFPEDVLKKGKKIASLNGMSFSAFMRDLLIREVNEQKYELALEELKKIEKIKERVQT